MRSELEALGAEIVNVSTDRNYANLNARLTPGKCKLLPKTVRKLDQPIQNESIGANDLAPQLRNLQRRLARIEKADASAAHLIRGVTDQDTVDGILMLRELANNERRNLTQQIDNYAQQASYCQVYVNFNAPQ